jgi:hypothetical protein
MTELARTLRAFRGLSEALREAVAETTLAYDFTANSYSYSAMNACIGAERALAVLREALQAADIALAGQAQGAHRSKQ